MTISEASKETNVKGEEILKAIECLGAFNSLGHFEKYSPMGEVGTFLVNRLRGLCDLKPMD